MYKVKNLITDSVPNTSDLILNAFVKYINYIMNNCI